MRLAVLVTGMLLSGLAAAPVAFAYPGQPGAPAIATLTTTQSSSSGGVTATFTFSGSYPYFSGERLTITDDGAVLYAQPVSSSFCGAACDPAASTGKHVSVHVIDLGHNGAYDVVLDLYSGGAHCCSIEQVLYPAPTALYRPGYKITERNFGDPGEEIVDLRHNGRFEFLTADDAFAYAFTDYADSGLPIQILTFSAGKYTNVTRSYPKLIAKDAASWLSAYRSGASDHWRDTVGFIAAWAADEDMLGKSALVARYLAAQQLAGHLNSGPGLALPSGIRFVVALQQFLRDHGYVVS